MGWKAFLNVMASSKCSLTVGLILSAQRSGLKVFQNSKPINCNEQRLVAMNIWFQSSKSEAVWLCSDCLCMFSSVFTCGGRTELNITENTAGDLLMISWQKSFTFNFLCSCLPKATSIKWWGFFLEKNRNGRQLSGYKSNDLSNDLWIQMW